MSGSKQNLLSIQILRGVAALMVVVGHATYIPLKYGIPGTNSFIYGGAGVDIFFVISGAVMVISSRRLIERADGWAIFLRRRLVRVVPLYWILSLVAVGIVLVAPGLMGGRTVSVSYVVSSLLFFPARNSNGEITPILGQGWTLMFEMLFYLGFAVCLYLKRNPILLLSLVFVPMSIAAPLLPKDAPTFIKFFCDGHLLEFISGMAIARLLTRTGQISWQIAATGVLIVCAYPFWASLFVQLPLVATLPYGILATLLVLSSSCFERFFTSRVWAPALGLGDASYAIYLTHLFVLPAVERPLIILGLGNALGGMTIAATGVAAACIIGYLVHLWFERPIADYLKGRLASRTSAALSASPSG